MHHTYSVSTWNFLVKWRSCSNTCFKCYKQSVVFQTNRWWASIQANMNYQFSQKKIKPCITPFWFKTDDIPVCLYIPSHHCLRYYMSTLISACLEIQTIHSSYHQYSLPARVWVSPHNQLPRISTIHYKQEWYISHKDMESAGLNHMHIICPKPFIYVAQLLPQIWSDSNPNHIDASRNKSIRRRRLIHQLC